MSNKLRKIEKNVFNNTKIEMTQKEFQERIKRIDENYLRQYKDKLNRMKDEMEKQIHDRTVSIIDTISVELLNELANQMGAFDEDNEHIEDIRYRIQEIYTNTMESIKKYNKYKRPQREFNKKKNKISKMFNIKF